MKPVKVTLGWLAVMLLVVPAAVRAQDPPTVAPTPRASWLSDRRPVSIGDLLTVVVEERTSALERTNRTATESRDTRMTLGAESADFSLPISSGGLTSGNEGTSRNVGEANRIGNLTAVLTVRVVGIEANGVLRVEGERMLRIDGRDQELVVRGLVRPDDVQPSNIVFSNRIADAEIEYSGSGIKPKRGIISRILGIFWP